MGNRYVHTPIGIINTSSDIEGYECGARTGVTLGKKIVINTCLTKVMITRKDGSEEVIEPILIESCMNPEKKTIMPVSVVASYDKEKKRYTITVTNIYKCILLDEDNDIVAARTEKYVPHIKKADCANCNNCGRC